MQKTPKKIIPRKPSEPTEAEYRKSQKLRGLRAALTNHNNRNKSKITLPKILSLDAE